MVQVYEGLISKEPVEDTITLTRDGRLVLNNHPLPVDDNFYFLETSTRSMY